MKDKILQALRQVIDIQTGQNIVSAGMISGLTVSKNHVSFALEVNPTQGAAAEPLRQAAEKAAQKIAPKAHITVVLTAHKVPSSPPPSPTSKIAPSPLSCVRHVVAIASGKGGVGKSTVAVNLACALHQKGLNVGLLDADVYGPSLPRMLHLKDQPAVTEDKLLIPLEREGIKVISMGFLVADNTAMVWRGPMVISALKQFLHGTQWGTPEKPLDILVVDMPPGTGDAQLTLSQKIDLSGAVIVSTPQDIALLDARRGVEMFRKVNVPILGLVENMSYFMDPAGEKHFIFGEDGAKAMAAELGVDCLAQLPLNLLLRKACDAGTPLVEADPASEIANLFHDIAHQVWQKIQGESADIKPDIKTA